MFVTMSSRVAKFILFGGGGEGGGRLTKKYDRSIVIE